LYALVCLPAVIFWQSQSLPIAILVYCRLRLWTSRLAIANIGHQGCRKCPESDSCRYDLYEIGNYYHEYGTHAKCDISSVQCTNRQERGRGENRSERKEGAAERRGEEGAYFE
jgi:hypothetical protein